MKKAYFICLLILMSVSAKSQISGFPNYNNIAPIPMYVLSPGDWDIAKFTLNGRTNTSNCNAGGSTTAINSLPASQANLYSNYTNITPYYMILTQGASTPWEVECGSAYPYGTYPQYCAIFIDYNRNGTFESTELVGSGNGTSAATATCTNTVVGNGSFVVPNTVSVGPTLCRVILSYYYPPTNGNTVSSWTTPYYYYGETEDYVVFLGQKKWDYTVSKMLAPDSISFCGDDPKTFTLEVRNVGNQPLTGGKLDVIMKGLEAGSTTNLTYSTTFNSTILDGGFDQFNIGPITFPKDELLEFRFVITHPFDTLRDNDTFIKRIQVYKSPVFTLKTDTVCVGQTAKVALINAPKPVYLKWDNEAITDTTSYLTTATQTRGITVWRGFKCRKDATIEIVALPNPTLSLSRDTVLCTGQKVDLVATSNADSFNWDDDPKSTTSTITNIPSVNRIYTLTAKSKIIAGRQCRTVGSVQIKSANPPSRPYISDTICLGDVATLGLGSTHPDFLYTWEGRSETTPVISPTPTSLADSVYTCKWTFQGCTDKDKVSIRILPLPNVQINTANPVICRHEISTLTAGGASTYQWANGLGTNNAITVSPATSTQYKVVGTDNKGCRNTKILNLIVNPQPNVYVFSNKRKDNVCLGDSATIYVNGAKDYTWNTGKTDSVIVLTPNTSFQWRVIGTDANGCKDTAEYRMTIKPSFNYDRNIDPIKGCEGTVAIAKIHSGGIAYQWGNNPSLINDTTANITLDNSTKYQVTVTSPDTCDIVVDIPITVYPKPLIEVSSATVCKGERATLEAKGGIADNYTWSSDPSATNLTNKESVLVSTTTVVTVTGKNIGGCSNEAYATVRVIQPQAVTFKSPVDTYTCPTVPVTMVATPAGGIWTSTAQTTDDLINNNIFKIGTSTPRGEYYIQYTLLDPINGCKTEVIKKVVITRTDKCSETVNSIVAPNAKDVWTVFPNPFKDQFTVKLNALKNEKATIQIYDVSGRTIYTQEQKLVIGDNEFSIQNQNWAKGVYYLDIQTPTTSRQQSIIKE